MRNRKLYQSMLMLFAASMLVACNAGNHPKKEAVEKQTEESIAIGEIKESAKDGNVNFEALKKDNSDIFAWLSIPGTTIDYPILQSGISDEYYKTHNEKGFEGREGALYTEMPNMMNLCDFNTVIHGKDLLEKDFFFELHKFEDPEFFNKNNKFYIYLPDNVLTYEIVAAYYDEGSDILRRYDYTTYQGCADYLNQIKTVRDMSKQWREGWDDLSPKHFLVTLNGSLRESDNKQYVLIGVLTEDAASKIDRVIIE